MAPYSFGFEGNSEWCVEIYSTKNKSRSEIHRWSQDPDDMFICSNLTRAPLIFQTRSLQKCTERQCVAIWSDRAESQRWTQKIKSSKEKFGADGLPKRSSWLLNLSKQASDNLASRIILFCSPSNRLLSKILTTMSSSTSLVEHIFQIQALKLVFHCRLRLPVPIHTLFTHQGQTLYSKKTNIKLKYKRWGGSVTRGTPRSEIEAQVATIFVAFLLALRNVLNDFVPLRVCFADFDSDGGAHAKPWKSSLIQSPTRN